MAEGKSSSKKKGTTVPLTTFLRPEASDWADEDPDNEQALPTAPGQAAGRTYPQYQASAYDESELPNEPPYKAFVGNLPYGMDAAGVGEYFEARVQVVDVNILRHLDTQKVKGAFVEFAGKEDLVKALQMNGESVKVYTVQPLMGRPMRVNIATGRKDSGRGDDRRGGFGDRGSGDFDDRRRGYDDRRGGFGDRRYDQFDKDAFDRRGGNFADRRGGPEPYRSAEAETKTWGHKNYVPGSPRRPATAAPAPAAQQPEPAPLAPRKKLVLAPRTVKAGEEPATASQETDDPKPAKANPFGSAKPVDAAAALKRIEEKIAKEKAEKREAEQKEKEEQQERAQKDLDARRAENSAEAPAKPESGGGPPPQQPAYRGPPPNGLGDFAPPPGMAGRGADRGRGNPWGRGDRGRAMPRGRGREYGRGRGPGPEFRGQEFSHIIRNPGHSQQPGGPNYQEARHPRNRGWENRPPPSSSPAPQAATQSAGQTSNEDQAKTRNMFDMLTTED